jgi:hypothetical protein
MARGWESKAVEDQIGAAEAKREARAKPAVSASDREVKVEREGLLLSRARIVGMLDVSRDDRYRAQLRQALEELDARLRHLG